METCCKICNNSEGNQIFRAREMMFGFRDEFTYFQCATCKCLQILDPPLDIAKYYPPNYYSFSATITKMGGQDIKRTALGMINFYLPMIKLTADTRILDVGCGSGTSVYALRECGYSHVLGIDPYIEKDIKYENGAVVMKSTIQDCNQEWDVILFNHSFEHLMDPLDTLQVVAGSLSKAGLCLIRTPTVSSYAWERYGANWVQLDAPRHFFLHSIESIKLISTKSGLQLFKALFDSTEFQFVGSEMYLRDIPLCANASIFTTAEIDEYKSWAAQLNHDNLGDQVALYFRPI